MFNIILAAGLSSRMKENKLLLKYNNKTFLHHLIKSSFEANLEVVVVTGCYKEEIELEVNEIENILNKKINLIHNFNYKLGQLSSLITGVKKIKELKNNEPYFISVADIPLLSKEDFLNLIPHLENHDALRPLVDGIYGHPVLINNKITDEIISLDFINKKEGLRSFLSKKDTIAFHSSNKAYINDIDTKEDYFKLISNPSL